MSMKRLAQKKKCIQHRALIVAWLRVNYCLRESGSIAKRDVFVHYIELCQANKIQPSSAASFGKILKMAFPTVKCNRVGPRGASKHHYRGLVLRDSYHLSLAGVQPISEAAISEMMRHLEEEEGRAASNKAAGRRSRESDEEEDDESDEKDDVDSDEGHASRVQVPSHYGAGVKREAHYQHLQPFASSQQLHHSTSPNELQPLSSSSVPSSPGAHRRGGGHGPYGGGGSSPPAANGYAAASSLYPGAGYAAAPQLHQQQPQQPQQHADEYRAPAFVLPPPGYSYAPYNNLLQQQQLQQQQQQHSQTAATARFSWVSPEMDAARGGGGGVFPVLPLPGQQQQQQQLPGHADKEWMEKRELVSFCERTFESLYDTILRTNCGPSKDQVLTYIVDAWKNLQDYTRQHMSLLPPSAVAAAAAAASPQQVAMQQAQQQQHHHQLPPQQPPRYHELDDELKRKAVLDSYHNNNAPSLAQFHQPLVEHMQQDGMRSASPVSPPSSSSSSSSAATSAAVASSTAPSSSSAPTEANNHSHSTNSDTNLGHLGLLMPPPSGFSFTGSSSALSLSWLNSMVATSMQNVAAAAQAQQRPPALHSPTLAHSPLNSSSNNGNNNSGPGGGYGLPFADLVGKRGSLEGLDYRSFEWKGAF